MRHYTEQTGQQKNHYRPSDAYPYQQAARRSMHKPHSALGATGHWIHLLSVAAPLVIAESIKDPDKKWRALRIAAVAAPLLSEAAWTLKVLEVRSSSAIAPVGSGSPGSVEPVGADLRAPICGYPPTLYAKTPMNRPRQNVLYSLPPSSLKIR